MKTKNYASFIIAFVLCISQVFAQTAPCPAPTGLTSTNVTSNSATVSWLVAGNAASYNVRYRVNGTNTWTVVNTATNSKVLVNLLALTNYEWQVQRGCPGPNGGITFSAYSTSAFFTTLGSNTACPTPTGLFTNNITATTARLHWGSTGAAQYKIRYRSIGTTAWIIKYSNNLQKDLTGLNPGGSYEWQVRSKCIAPSTGVITWSPWSGISVFQTLSSTGCSTPTNLTSASALNGVNLQWSATGATSYNIRYKPSNTAAWNNTTSGTNSKNLTGLPGATSFEWQVQSVCAANGAITLSAWSASAFFTTNSPASLSPNPARDKITVSVERQAPQNVHISIRDLFGATHATETRTATSGLNQFDINVSNLKNGFYYIELTDNEGTQTVKFYVEH